MDSKRLRFTSPHPIGFRDDLIDAISRLPKLAEHVHLPLQSGSNKILKAMHRAYTAEKYVDLVQRIRRARYGIAITTDIIVGFPGETEDDYQQTRDLVEQIQFDNAFVFRYSPRRGTPAANMPDQIDERTKEERNQDLLRIVNESNRRKLERLVGRDVEVLCEGPSKTNPARLMGRTRTNKIVVFPPSPRLRRTGEGGEELVGELVDVRVEQANGFSLYGTPVKVDRASALPSTASPPRRIRPMANRRHALTWQLFELRRLNRKLKTCATLSKLTRHQRSSPMIYHLSLHTAGIIAGAFLVLIGLLGLLKPDLASVVQRFPRSRVAGVIVLTICLVWTFWLLATIQMGEFSAFRRPLLIALPIGYGLTLGFVDEFLAVRALGILCLLAAEPLLDAAFLRYETSRLLITVFAYALIVAGLFWVAIPYVLRDQINWSTRSVFRWRCLHAIALIYGGVILTFAFAKY